MSNALKKFRPKKPKAIKLKTNGESPQLTMPDMYTLNKQLMAKEPILSYSEIDALKNSLIGSADFAIDNNYILLCRERYDFTAFRCKKSVMNMIDEMVEILSLRGAILSIDRQEDGTYECWILDSDNEAIMYKFFKADWIIEC